MMAKMTMGNWRRGSVATALAVPLLLLSGCSGDADIETEAPEVSVSPGDVDVELHEPDLPDVDVDADVEDPEDGDDDAGPEESAG